MSPDSIFTKCLSLVIKTKQKQKTNSSTCFCRHRLCCPSYVAVLGCTLGDGEFCQGHDKALQGCLKNRKEVVLKGEGGREARARWRMMMLWCSCSLDTPHRTGPSVAVLRATLDDLRRIIYPHRCLGTDLKGFRPWSGTDGNMT